MPKGTLRHALTAVAALGLLASAAPGAAAAGAA
ncbi:MAG: chorismate mutase, partial [Streptomyces sp.]|nr:chorismate mutase [Streptomyces sp.]